MAGSFVFLAMIVSGRWDITQDTQSPQSSVTPALPAALVEDPGTVEINPWLCPALSPLNPPRLGQVLAGYSYLCPHVLSQVHWPRAAKRCLSRMDGNTTLVSGLTPRSKVSGVPFWLERPRVVSRSLIGSHASFPGT